MLDFHLFSSADEDPLKLGVVQVHILFVICRDFGGNSGIHTFHLANHMAQRGVDCTVAVPSDPFSVETFGSPKFEVIQYRQVRDRFLRDAPFDLIHAWTPRENTRRITQDLVKRFRVPYLVHLEDNEDVITGDILGEGSCWSKWLRTAVLDVHPKGGYFSHPRRYKCFLDQASGVTLIFQTLADFVPSRINNITFWPSCEPEFFDIPSEVSPEAKARFGINPEDMVIGYPGNIHRTNLAEVATLYEAVSLARGRGLPLTLLRAGAGAEKLPSELRTLEQKKWVVELGEIGSRQMYSLIEAADALVQPGQANLYNNYRFPSKLPMFLASGRPVILPPANLASYLTPEENCIILEHGTPAEIVSHLERLWQSGPLARKLGQGGRQFAARNFSWTKSAARVVDFYERILGGGT